MVPIGFGSANGRLVGTVEHRREQQVRWSAQLDFDLPPAHFTSSPVTSPHLCSITTPRPRLSADASRRICLSLAGNLHRAAACCEHQPARDASAAAALLGADLAPLPFCSERGFLLHPTGDPTERLSSWPTSTTSSLPSRAVTRRMRAPSAPAEGPRRRRRPGTRASPRRRNARPEAMNPRKRVKRKLAIFLIVCCSAEDLPRGLTTTQGRVAISVVNPVADASFLPRH